MLRHMRSLRSMRRDNGWIHTLLEEAENERMHLLTFLQLRQPGLFFRGMVLLSQVWDGSRVLTRLLLVHGTCTAEPCMDHAFMGCAHKLHSFNSACNGSLVSSAVYHRKIASTA